MITTEGKNACLRVNFCGMPQIYTWYLAFYNQNNDEYTDYEGSGRPVWTPQALIDEKVIGHSQVTPLSYDIILGIALVSTDSGTGIRHAYYTPENPIEFNPGQTLSIRLPVGWR